MFERVSGYYDQYVPSWWLPMPNTDWLLTQKYYELTQQLLKQAEMYKEKLEMAEKLIEAKEEQIKFLSEYIKSGGMKIFEDC